MVSEANAAPGDGSAVGGGLLSERYDAIVDECMALAAVWRSRIADSLSDKTFHADQHRRALLRAASFARMADKSRTIEGWSVRAPVQS